MMSATIVRIPAILFLCSICFFPLLRLVAPGVTDTSLPVFLFMSLLHAIFMCGVAWLLNRSAGRAQPFDSSNRFIGLFLFLSGVFFVVAFGMGAPPRDANEWIANGAREMWRAIFLELAIVCTALGLYFFSRLINIQVSKFFAVVFLVLTFIGATLTVYDFYLGLLVIPRDIDTWSKEGKDLAQFFNQYDLRNGIRGSARCFIYAVSLLTFFACWKLRIVKTWVAVILSLLCVFFLQDVFVPLISDVSSINLHIGMVPAVALSPLYLLGVYWLAVYRNT